MRATWYYDAVAQNLFLYVQDLGTVANIWPNVGEGWRWCVSSIVGNGPAADVAATIEEARDKIQPIVNVHPIENWDEARAASGWTNKRTVTAEQIRDALVKHPRLLWDTLNNLLAVKVAGPWECQGDAHVRKNPRDRLKLVWIVHTKKGRFPVWFNTGAPSYDASTLEEAKRKADSLLRDEGWILVGDS